MNKLLSMLIAGLFATSAFAAGTTAASSDNYSSTGRSNATVEHSSGASTTAEDKDIHKADRKMRKEAAKADEKASKADAKAEAEKVRADAKATKKKAEAKADKAEATAKAKEDKAEAEADKMKK